MKDTEPDDYLHNPDPIRDLKIDKGGSILTGRGVANLGCLFVLVAGFMTLLLVNRNYPSVNELTRAINSAGYPIMTHFLKKVQSDQGGFNIGGINATGQVATMPGNFGLIDLDTPKDAYTMSSFMNPDDEWDLVFSDEFNVDGRTFYPGDDPYWEAVRDFLFGFHGWPLITPQ